MNKFVSVFVVVALLLIVAEAPSVSAKAEVVTTRVTDVFPPGDLPPLTLCDGSEELLFVGGEVDRRFHTVVDGNGGFRMTMHATFYGFRWENPATGTVAETTGVINLTQHGEVDQVIHVVANIRERVSVPGTDLFTRIRQDLVINANGEVTIIRIDVTTECR